MQNIILNLEYEQLLNEIKTLKDEIVNLFQEKDFLIHHTCKLINVEYIKKIGFLEYEAYKYQCNMLRLKRKLTLIQTKINRQEPIDECEMEAQLDIEYSEYIKKMEKMATNVQDSLKMKESSLSEKEAMEIKNIYRSLVKKLHPDLNPNRTPKETELFSLTVNAYENGDLNTLRIIEVLASNIKELSDKDMIKSFKSCLGLDEDDNINEMEILKITKKNYQNKKDNLVNDIIAIKADFPYNQIDFLSDEYEVEKKQSQINANISEYKSTIIKLEKYIFELLNNIKYN
ncbi:MAG: J domain-containing protein [Fusobacteriaceae bacterium]|jgi:hypothetical protein|nr:J domain-containing protein [Fusobacteriaceae bacterium]